MELILRHCLVHGHRHLKPGLRRPMLPMTSKLPRCAPSEGARAALDLLAHQASPSMVIRNASYFWLMRKTRREWWWRNTGCA